MPLFPYEVFHWIKKKRAGEICKGKEKCGLEENASLCMDTRSSRLGYGGQIFIQKHSNLRIVSRERRGRRRKEGPSND